MAVFRQRTLLREQPKQRVVVSARQNNTIVGKPLDTVIAVD
jgi:hypothetical protein